MDSLQMESYCFIRIGIVKIPRISSHPTGGERFQLTEISTLFERQEVATPEETTFWRKLTCFRYDLAIFRLWNISKSHSAEKIRFGVHSAAETVQDSELISISGISGIVCPQITEAVQAWDCLAVDSTGKKAKAVADNTVWLRNTKLFRTAPW